jgi:hypothetical protein
MMRVYEKWFGLVLRELERDFTSFDLVARELVKMRICPCKSSDFQELLQIGCFESNGTGLATAVLKIVCLPIFAVLSVRSLCLIHLLVPR